MKGRIKGASFDAYLEDILGSLNCAQSTMNDRRVFLNRGVGVGAGAFDHREKKMLREAKGGKTGGDG